MRLRGPRVRTVLLDAGNTLLRMNYGAIADALRARGMEVEPEAVQRAEWRARVRLDEDFLARARPGTSTESGATGARYLRYVLDALGVRDPATVEGMVQWRIAYNPPVGLWNILEPAAEPALRLARKAGLGTAVISNSNGSVRSILGDLGLLPHLDFVLDSGEVGVEKPDPRIFRLALERAGVEPTEAVYVGDLYTVDVRGARAAGIEAVLIDPGGHWGPRDCPRARDVLEAVHLLLGPGD